MRLNKKTKEAVIKSRDKWIKIWKGTGYDEGADNCALCGLFNDIAYILSCKGCPIDNKGKLNSGCNYTPYTNWRYHHHHHHYNNRATTKEYRIKYCKKCLKIAKDEAIFIDKLLPKKERWFKEVK